MLEAVAQHLRSQGPGRPPTALWCGMVMGIVWLSLRTRGFAQTLQAAKCWGRCATRTPEISDHALIPLTAHRVAVAAAFVPLKARCLEQSITLFVLLRRLGVNAEFRLGVQPYHFRAHAWVECDGKPVNERPDIIRGFVTLPEIPL